MKIEKNIYIRTKEGLIAKIEKEDNNEYFIIDIELPTGLKYEINKEDIIKASYNIIDLIEEGDYVNEYYVYCVINGKIYVDTLDFKVGKNYFEKEDIFTIVTKEQFKNMEYRIE